MNDSKIAFRAKEQLGKFLGKVFTHFSKPRKKFLADMLYGMQASGDTRIPRGAAEPPKAVARGVLSSIMRAIPVRLPMHPEKELHMVVVKGFVKREVLAEHLKSLSQRLGKVPEFANYAIADGLKRAFSRLGKWCRKIIDPEPEPTEDDLLKFLPGFRDMFAADFC